jgi:competence protein ComEC
MWMLAMLWHSRNKQWLWAAACLSLGLMGWQMIETHRQNDQKLIVVHAIPQHTAVSMIEGRSLKLLADSAFLADQRSFNFYLGNFYAKRGINNITLVALENPNQPYIRSLDFGKIVSFQHRNLLILEKSIETIPNQFDWILATKNAVKETDLLPSNRPVIFDNSNKWYISKPIYERAMLQKLPQHISSEEGAKVIEW